MFDIVGLVAGSGFASGVNLYATALLLGVFGRVLEDAPIPEALTSTPFLVVAGVLTAVEFFADKVPWFDSVWDTIHTVVRPLGAAALAAVLLDGGPLVEDLFAAGTDPAPDDGDIGGVAGAMLAAILALVAHSAKASTRLAVNTSPEPFSNSIVSIFEDGLVAGVVFLAVQNPTAALVVVGVLTLVAVGLVVALWRIVRSVRQRVRRSSLRGRMRDVSR